MQLRNNETARILDKEVFLKLNLLGTSNVNICKNLQPTPSIVFPRVQIQNSYQFVYPSGRTGITALTLPPLASGAIGSHHTYRLCTPAFQHESSWPWTALQSVLVFLLPLGILKPVPKRKWVSTTSPSTQCQAAGRLKAQDRIIADCLCLHPEVCSHLGPAFYSYTQHGPKDSWERTQPIPSMLLANTSNLKLMNNGKKFRASCKLFPKHFPSPRAA